MTVMEFAFKTKPYAHQEEIWNQTRDSFWWAYFLEMGTGKTKLLLDVAGHLFCKGKIDTLIVTAPNGVYGNWVHKEIPEHLSVPYRALAWRQHDLSTMKWKHAWKRLLVTEGQLAVYCCNIESVRTPNGFAHLMELLNKRKALWAIDESTTIKNPKAMQTRACLRLAPKAAYRRILSGSPVTQGPLDLWSQCRFLHPYALPYQTWTGFKAAFAIEQRMILGQRTFQKIVGYRNLDILQDYLKRFSSRVLKSECLDLPEKIFTTRQITLHKEQERLYKEIRQKARAELTTKQMEGTITADHVLTAMHKLHQIVTGFVRDDEGLDHELPNNRIEEVLQVAHETGEKMIIWCAYVKNIQMLTAALEKEFGRDCLVSYYGETSGHDRAAAIKRFQEDESCRFFLSNETGARGITLTAAHTVIYFSNTPNLDTRMQSEDRAHRIGQRNPVTYVDFLTPKHMDEYFLGLLLKKRDIQDEILNHWQEII